MKKELKERARYFRKIEGQSVRQIATRLGVSKGSVSAWVRDIKLSKKHLINLERQNPASKKFTGLRTASEINRQRAKDKRTIYQQQGRQECSDFNLHLAGCMLYWAEGSKSRNSLTFTNTDASMLLLFIKFLKEICLVKNEDILIACRSHILSPYTLEDVENYWLKTLGLNKANLRKGSVETRIPKVKSVKYPYGICAIIVHKVDLIQRIFGAIKGYAGITDENLWL